MLFRSVRSLAEQVRSAVGVQAEIVFDRSKPDGTPRKLLDVERLRTLGWVASVSLPEGLVRAYASYLEQDGNAGNIGAMGLHGCG